MDVFTTAEKISCPEIAKMYGMRPEHGNILCFLHSERKPSMHVYPHNFYCFSCGGSANGIGAVSAIFGISRLEAAKKICEDFGLSFEWNGKKTAGGNFGPLPPAKSIDEVITDRVDHYALVCIDYIRLLDRWKELVTDPLNEYFMEALEEYDTAVFLCDTLLQGNIYERYEALILFEGRLKRYESRCRIFS